MATAYASHNTAKKEATTTSDSLTITKPTGLAEGDLMIFIGGGAETIGDFSASGWTQFVTNTGTNVQANGLYKIATSGDAAASNFTFNVTTAAGSHLVGALFRITGTSFTNGNNIKVASTGGAGGTSLSFNTSLVPFSTGTLLMMAFVNRTNGSVSYASHAIANNNPTWTERVDDGSSTASRDSAFTIATATASAASATGNQSVTVTGTAAGTVAIMIAVQEDTSVTANLNTLAVSPTFNALTPTAGVTATLDTLLISPTLNDPTGVATERTQWTNETIDPTSWINET